jgi:hypothetical protein
MILEHIERWPTLGIERDDLTIDYGFVREPVQRVRAINVKRLVKFFPFRESNWIRLSALKPNAR